MSPVPSKSAQSSNRPEPCEPIDLAAPINRRPGPRSVRGKSVGFASRVLQWEFARFLVTGATAAAVNLLSAGAIAPLVDTPWFFEASVAIGFTLGSVVSFYLNKYFTFHANDGNSWFQFARFALVAAVSVVVSTLVAHEALSVLNVVRTAWGFTTPIESIAHVATVGIMTIFNYVGIKFVAFGRPAAWVGRKTSPAERDHAAEQSLGLVGPAEN